MRKKFIASLAALLLIFSLIGTTALAESAAVIGNAVNLRSGPGTGYDILDTLVGGTVVEVTGYSGTWAAVNYNGMSGYMASGYLSTLSSAYQTASVDVAGSAAADEGSAVIVLDGASSGSSGAASNAYTGSANVVLPAAQESYTGTATVTVPATASAPISTVSAASSSNEGSSVIVLANGTIVGSTAGGAASVANTTAVSYVGKSGTINMDFVCLRSGPGSSYGIISTYNKGKELVITGEPSGSWTPCMIDNRSGYVYTQYITLREQQSNAAAQTAPVSTVSTGTNGAAVTTLVSTTTASGNAGYITGNNVRLRSGPSMSSEILGELFYGNSVSITGTSGDWTAVVCNGRSGYVYSQYVHSGSYQQTAQTTAQTGGSSAGAIQAPVATPVVSASGVTGQQIAAYALQFVGYPYKWGGMSPETGFDCSGFVKYVYSQFGYTLNRVAGDQASNGVHVDNSALQPGDVLCFYSSANYIGHTGIYVGNNKFVHASTSTTGVILSELSGYYTDRGFVARRIL